MRKDLSVVIAAYNAADTLGTQLEALVGQAPGLSWEVVVADNRSTDATAAVAESYADRLDLRLVPAPAKPNAAYARNAAAATAPARLLNSSALPRACLPWCSRRAEETARNTATPITLAVTTPRMFIDSVESS